MSRLSPLAAAKRARLIKIVQTGRNVLRLDEDTYRALLATKADGKRSAKDLSIGQLEAVIKHMRACGFTPRAPGERRALDTSPTAGKARALWLWLHGVGIVRDPSEAALASFAKRITRTDALQWARGQDKLIEGIKSWAARELRVKLAARIEAAGQLADDVTIHRLVIGVSPTLNPTTFDALQRAWLHLDHVGR